MKSTPDEIRARFDNDVERFSNLDTGQSATIDAPLVLRSRHRRGCGDESEGASVLDVGCGAGNYTLKLLEKLPNLSVALIDLSRPMLDRAVERINAAGARDVTPLQGDVRELSLTDQSFNIILAAAVLHHLRSDDEWLAVFRTFHRTLRPGGSVWIADLVQQSTPAVQTLMWRRYGDFLEQLGGADYREKVFAYVEKEDSPRDVMFQTCSAAPGSRRSSCSTKKACLRRSARGTRHVMPRNSRTPARAAHPSAPRARATRVRRGA